MRSASAAGLAQQALSFCPALLTPTDPPDPLRAKLPMHPDNCIAPCPTLSTGHAQQQGVLLGSLAHSPLHTPGGALGGTGERLLPLGSRGLQALHLAIPASSALPSKMDPGRKTHNETQCHQQWGGWGPKDILTGVCDDLACTACMACQVNNKQQMMICETSLRSTIRR